jgi:hypothetical protein
MKRSIIHGWIFDHIFVLEFRNSILTKEAEVIPPFY